MPAPGLPSPSTREPSVGIAAGGAVPQALATRPCQGRERADRLSQLWVYPGELLSATLEEGAEDAFEFSSERRRGSG